MLDARGDGGFHQGARLDGVVVVVAERIGDRFRDDDGAGEMDDGLDAVLADHRADQLLVADVADDQRRGRRNSPAKAGRQVVEDDDLLARIQ